MKDLIKPETKRALRSARTEKVLERLEDSVEFWDLMAKVVDGEVSNADLLADLDIEVNHANQSIDEEEVEFPDYYDGEEHA